MLTANISGLCDGGAIEPQIFSFAQKLNRRTTVELCSFAPLLQNPCYLQVFYLLLSSFRNFLSNDEGKNNLSIFENRYRGETSLFLSEMSNAIS